MSIIHPLHQRLRALNERLKYLVTGLYGCGFTGGLFSSSCVCSIQCNTCICVLNINSSLTSDLQYLRTLLAPYTQPARQTLLQQDGRFREKAVGLASGEAAEERMIFCDANRNCEVRW